MPLLLGLCLAVAGCSTGRTVDLGVPIPEPAVEASRLERATVPADPERIVFAWTLDEAGSRVGGQGVVRVAAPERIRLDLFGPRNESYLSAALVDGEYRLPPRASGEVPLPSPALLWAGLGVVHPPAGAELVGATRSGEIVALTYAAPQGEQYRYRLADDSAGVRLLSLDRAGRSGVLETVRLERRGEGLPRVRYRNLAEYRELVLLPESRTTVDAFSDAIWSL